MGRRLVFTGPSRVSFQDYSEPKLKPDQIRVQTLFSGISHGTEMNVYRGTAPFFSKNWDPQYRIFTNDGGSWIYPLSYGYEEVCRIIELGDSVKKLEIGDHLCTAYGHQTTGVLDSAQLAPHDSGFEGYIIPNDVNPIFGVFHLLSNVALNGVHSSGIKLGDNIAIFGLGVMGLLVTQFSKLSGANKLIAVDLVEKRLELARKFGAEVTLNPKTKLDIAKEIKNLTKGGVDIAFECSGSHIALHEAVRSCAYRTKVIALGWYQGGGKELFLGEEFHHNQISIVSESDGLPSALGRMWNGKRIEEEVFNLIREGKLEVQNLITHTFPFESAPEAYRFIDEQREEVVKCVLTFCK